MIEVIKELNLGEWAVAVLVISALWRWVLKGFVEKWFQHNLSLKSKEIEFLLKTQQDITVRNAEFEKVKLEKALPLLESLSSVISEHKRMNNSYMSWIINKGGMPGNFEEKRVELDGKLLDSLSSAEIYFPNEHRHVTRQIRKIVSCSWRDPSQIYYQLLDIGTYDSVADVCSDTNDIYQDLLSCFYDMCNKYTGTSECNESYKEILLRHNFSSDVKPIEVNPAQNFLWRHILLHEYTNRADKEKAIEEVKNEYS